MQLVYSQRLQTQNCSSTTHHCLVEHRLNKTRQNFLLTLRISLCQVLDCQTEAQVTYNNTIISQYWVHVLLWQLHTKTKSKLLP